MIPALLGVGALLAKVATVSAICKAVTALKSALVSPPSPEVSSPEPDSHVKYTFDHLGSIRELVDASGVVQAAYRYSTYGERSKTSGNLDFDWGYAGLWHHQGSGLDLATYRLYDAANKRWISRDPLGEGVDYNLYRYCGNNPVSNIDPEGLEPTGPPWDIPKDWNWHRGAQGESEYDDFKRLPTRYIPSPVRKPKQKKCPDTFAEQSPGGGVGYSDWNFGINKPDIHKTRIEDLKKPVPFPKTYGIHGRVQRILTVLLDLDSGNAQRDREAQDAWNRLSPQEQARRREEERGLRDMMNQNQP